MERGRQNPVRFGNAGVRTRRTRTNPATMSGSAQTAQRRSTNPALAQMLDVASANSKHLMNANGLASTMYDTTLYINANVAGISGIHNVVDVNIKKIVGITNFDGNKFNTGRNIIIKGVRALFCETSNPNGDSLQKADWFNNDRLPAELQNSELSIMQGNKKKFSIPMSDLQGQKFEDFRKVFTNPFIAHNEEFEIQIETPKGVSVPGEDVGKFVSYLRLEFQVAEAKF